MDRRTERELYERELRRDAEISRSTASANTALMIGVFIVAITALGAVFFVTTRQNEPQAPDINIEIPEPQAPQVQPPDVNINIPEVNLPQTGTTTPAESENTQPASPTSESPQQ